MLAVRQAQDMAGFQTVDIAVDKGVRVERLDSQHGLLDRSTITVLLSNFPQGVARSRGVLSGFADSRRSAGRRAQTRRGCARGRSRCWLFELGRVEQHTVVAHQAAIGPLHLQQETHIGIRQRLARRDTHHAAPARVDHRGKRQVIEERLAINACVYKCLVGGQAGRNLGSGEATDIKQFDFHRQRLVQLRLEGHLPKLQRLRHTGGQRRGGRYC